MVQFRSLFLVLFFVVVIFGGSGLHADVHASVKEPNVAGSFYEADSKKLSAHVSRLLESAHIKRLNDNKSVLVIAPHAGYRYSGQVAAYSYATLQNRDISTVIIISPSHYYSFDGIAVWSEGAFKTPLGEVLVDDDVTKQFLEYADMFSHQPQVFDREHGLETQLPFIQKVLPDAQIVPMIMGKPDSKVLQQLAAAFDNVIGDRQDIVVVVSADLSHYHPYDEAVTLDRKAIDAIVKYDINAIWQESLKRTMEIDAFHAVSAVMIYAKNKNYQPRLLTYANSGDVTGDKSRVVGYASIVFERNERSHLEHQYSNKQLTIEQQRTLLKLARSTIDYFLKHGETPDVLVTDPRLHVQEGAFVTIHKNHHLRGCIGHIISQQPLYKTVQEVAVLAATQDPRFEALNDAELGQIEVEISVLSKPWRVDSAAEIELGRHGVILSKGRNHRGVFLPQVADETGWSKEEFLSQLASQKAGLARDDWKNDDVILEVFTAQVFGEGDVDE